MDTLKRLTLEFNGIRDTIANYTSKGNISNFVNGLEIALSARNIEEIKYFLNETVQWYENNIAKIQSNSYVTNPDDHERNIKLLQKFKEEFEVYTLVEDIDMEKDNYEKQPLIFISHKSNDKNFGHALEKFIIGLGVQNNQLIYTSHPLHKIPLDSNIYEYLREHINDNVFMIILWSDLYLDSPACLNEMGAAWVVQCDYTNIYIPTFSFGNPKYRECAVDTNKMGAVLNGDEHCKANMIELKNKICTLFDISIPEKDFVYLLDSFIEEITNISAVEVNLTQKNNPSVTNNTQNDIQKLREQYGDSMVDMMADKLTDEIIKTPATQKMINQRTTQNFLRKKKR